MLLNYRFRVHQFGVKAPRRFQLRVGLDGDADAEFLPAHRTAFAEEVTLEPAHATEVEAHLELSGLLEWLGKRRPASAGRAPTS